MRLHYVTRKDIPIYLATRGSKFKLVGELCNGTLTHGKTLMYVQRMIDHISKGAKIVRRRLKDIEIGIVLPFMIIRSKKDMLIAKKILRPLLTVFVGGEWTLEWADALGFTIEELNPIRKEIHEYNFTKAQKFVNDKLLDKMVDAYCIVGSIEECISEVEKLKKAGITQIIPIMRKEWGESGKFLKLFGEKIIQSFKE